MRGSVTATAAARNGIFNKGTRSFSNFPRQLRSSNEPPSDHAIKTRSGWPLINGVQRERCGARGAQGRRMVKGEDKRGPCVDSPLSGGWRTRGRRDCCGRGARCLASALPATKPPWPTQVTHVTLRDISHIDSPDNLPRYSQASCWQVLAGLTLQPEQAARLTFFPSVCPSEQPLPQSCQHLSANPVWAVHDTFPRPSIPQLTTRVHLASKFKPQHTWKQANWSRRRCVWTLEVSSAFLPLHCLPKHVDHRPAAGPPIRRLQAESPDPCVCNMVRHFGALHVSHVQCLGATQELHTSWVVGISSSPPPCYFCAPIPGRLRWAQRSQPRHLPCMAGLRNPRTLSIRSGPDNPLVRHSCWKCPTYPAQIRDDHSQNGSAGAMPSSCDDHRRAVGETRWISLAGDASCISAAAGYLINLRLGIS
ncbi:hypothetical protein BV25DRAFT_327218 [Artomyces pyxidatus]|uniref:Uncharacterized protein n=1 Tax=Artomyces pyxidatus TaxID=48021 RepID=A0ACB8T5E1_9AGAM|nr:hypothetical protein BV25DRAFT_327218 [Artomyces pyxidatus]